MEFLYDVSFFFMGGRVDEFELRSVWSVDRSIGRYTAFNRSVGRSGRLPQPFVVPNEFTHRSQFALVHPIPCDLSSAFTPFFRSACVIYVPIFLPIPRPVRCLDAPLRPHAIPHYLLVNHNKKKKIENINNQKNPETKQTIPHLVTKLCICPCRRLSITNANVHPVLMFLYRLVCVFTLSSFPTQFVAFLRQ